MSTKDPDDPSFADEMARMGVIPLDRVRADKSAGRARSERGKRPDMGREPEPREAKAPALKTGGAAQDTAALEHAAELARVRRELVESHAARAELERQRALWAKERVDIEARFDKERAEDKGRERERVLAMEARERELRRELALAREELAGRRSLADVLRARGCADEGEAITVLQMLLDIRPRDLLDAVELASPRALAQLLDQRVAFVADDVDDMQTTPDCVIIRVPPARCEITGGSDIRAAFHQLVQACKRASITQVTIVGGSPAYRRQLEQLAERHGEGLVLNLVSGTKRRARKRAEADMRASDLVVIWGATELDHSVSEVYTRAPDKTAYVAHRGISRMLAQVAEVLDRRSRR